MITSLHRPNTPARWKAAHDRARQEGVSVRQLSASGAWIASSSTDPHVAYEVSVYRCTCKAAEFGDDPVCKHRAALRVHLGLPLVIGDAPPQYPAAVIAA